METSVGPCRQFVHLLYARTTVFRDENAQCPQCDTALDPVGIRRRCTACASVFITDGELGKLFDELSPDDERPLRARLFPADRQGRTCPFCQTTMARHSIHGWLLERCETHGVWIATQALQDLLNEHANQYIQRDSDRTKLEVLMFVPVVGVLAMPLQAVIRPWAKRRRLRKYLARSTPQTRS